MARPSRVGRRHNRRPQLHPRNDRDGTAAQPRGPRGTPAGSRPAHRSRPDDSADRRAPRNLRASHRSRPPPDAWCGVSAHVVNTDSRSLPIADSTVDLVVTSPPYFGLRSYTDGGKHYAGQVGDEATPAEFVAALLDVTAECVRVL